MLPDAKLCFANLIQVRAGAAATQILNMLKLSRESTAKQILGSERLFYSSIHFMHNNQMHTLNSKKHSSTEKLIQIHFNGTHDESKAMHIVPSIHI